MPCVTNASRRERDQHAQVVQRLGGAGVLERRLRRGRDVHPRLHDLALVQAEVVDDRAQVARERLELRRRAPGAARTVRVAAGRPLRAAEIERRRLAQQRAQVGRQRRSCRAGPAPAAAPRARASGPPARRRRPSHARRSSVGRSSSRNVGSSFSVRCRSRVARARSWRTAGRPAVTSVAHRGLVAPERVERHARCRARAGAARPAGCRGSSAGCRCRAAAGRRCRRTSLRSWSRPCSEAAVPITNRFRSRRVARRERADDLVELGRRLDLRVRQPAALGDLRRAARARRQLHVGLAQQRLRAQDRPRVARQRRVLASSSSIVASVRWPCWASATTLPTGTPEMRTSACSASCVASGKSTWTR